MNKTEMNNAIITLTDEVVAAAGQGMTRGEVQTLLVAGRFPDKITAIGMVSRVLDPRAQLSLAEIITRVNAVIEVAEQADIEVIRALLV